MSVLAKAIAVAEAAHRGQRDLNGQAFIGHPLRVMARCAPDLSMSAPSSLIEWAMMAAVLHDVHEDTMVRITPVDFGIWVFNALDALTHRKGKETYKQYIARVKQNPIAVKVKLADLRDNMDPARTWPNAESLIRRRYLPTWVELTGNEYDPERDGR